MSHLQSGNPTLAGSICDEALTRFPGDANLLCLSAKAKILLRQYSAAGAQLEEAIRLFPDFAVAHDTFGDLLLLQGRPAAAIKAYEQSIRLDPTRGDSLQKIERARQLLADATAKLEEQGASTPAAPQRTMAFADEVASAEEFSRNGDPARAEDIYRNILTRDPQHVEAARLLAKIAMDNKKFRDAEVFLMRAVDNAPDYARAWVDLCNVQRELEKFDDAEDSARQVLKLTPEMAESHMLLAGVVGMAGKHDEAMACYRRALDLEPNKPGALCSLAHHQKTLGQQDDAIANYRKALAAKPDHAEAFWSLANLKTFRFEQREVADMEALLERDDLADEARVQVHNALGLEYEGQKQYGAAFAHFEQCNTLRRKSERYDPVENESTCDRIIELFDDEFMARQADSGCKDHGPILIVGLPRSGSTLIEQILASHSLVDGTHELSDLSKSIQSLRKNSAMKSRFPESLGEIDAAQWAGLGEQYIERTRRYRGDGEYFIDKNPNNFTFIGALKIALPNAKVIDARRHPLDSTFGTYKQLFAVGQPFSYDITELGEYYIQYQRLMDQWRQVAPGFVLDVQYENVVADLEPQVRRILDFCGLPFEEACLHFHETERAVKTASSEQVRQPIYSSSVNLWRNYEEQLGELVHIMKPVLAALPEEEQPAALQSTLPNAS